MLKECKGTLAQLQKTVSNRAGRWAGDTGLRRADRCMGGELNRCHLEIDLKSRHSQQAPPGWMQVVLKVCMVENILSVFLKVLSHSSGLGFVNHSSD